MTLKKKRIFDVYRSSLRDAGLVTDCDDSLVCPLCWRETSFDRLSLEHIVPSEVGGKKTVLTCGECNNVHGSQLDSHLVQFQKVADAFEGFGTLKAELDVKGNRLVADLEWLEEKKNFRVVGKATDPSAWTEAHKHFRSGQSFNFNCKLHFGYRNDNFQRALLRAAYLIAFRRLGYDYVRHDIVQLLRRRIVDNECSAPELSSLIIEAANFKPPFDWQHYIVPGKINDIELMLVIIRLRRQTTKYLGVFLPSPTDRIEHFFSLMTKAKSENNGQSLSFPPQIMLS